MYAKYGAFKFLPVSAAFKNEKKKKPLEML